MSASERREQLLDVALEILCDEGAAALSIDAIAKGAGITRPVVYTQFGDLPGLLDALVDREEKVVLTQLAKAIPLNVGEIDPDDVIVNAIDTFLNAVRERPRTWQIVLTPPQGMPRSLHDKVVERREAVIEQITPLVAWGITKRADPRASTTACWPASSSCSPRRPAGSRSPSRTSSPPTSSSRRRACSSRRSPSTSRRSRSAASEPPGVAGFSGASCVQS